MIYTVTLNPSIDFIVRLDTLLLGSVNRMTSDDKYVGGKGINVSRILKRLKIDNTATGYSVDLQDILLKMDLYQKVSKLTLFLLMKIHVSTLK